MKEVEIKIQLDLYCKTKTVWNHKNWEWREYR